MSFFALFDDLELSDFSSTCPLMASSLCIYVKTCLQRGMDLPYTDTAVLKNLRWRSLKWKASALNSKS